MESINKLNEVQLELFKKREELYTDFKEELKLVDTSDEQGVIELCERWMGKIQDEPDVERVWEESEI